MTRYDYRVKILSPPPKLCCWNLISSLELEKMASDRDKQNAEEKEENLWWVFLNVLYYRELEQWGVTFSVGLLILPRRRPVYVNTQLLFI